AVCKSSLGQNLRILLSSSYGRSAGGHHLAGWRMIMLHAALLFTMAIQIQQGCNSDFMRNSWELLAAAHWGASRFEQAAFAVRTNDGGIGFLRWPASPSDFQAGYQGSIPPNTVAIVHTHPNGHPDPSGDDDSVARHLGIPVYVVTRTKV